MESYKGACRVSFTKAEKHQIQTPESLNPNHPEPEPETVEPKARIQNSRIPKPNTKLSNPKPYRNSKLYMNTKPRGFLAPLQIQTFTRA